MTCGPCSYRSHWDAESIEPGTLTGKVQVGDWISTPDGKLYACTAVDEDGEPTMTQLGNAEPPPPPPEPMKKTLLFDVSAVADIEDPVPAGVLSNTATLDVMFPDVVLDVAAPVTVALTLTEDTAQDAVATAYAEAWQAADTNVSSGDFFDVTAEGTKLFVTGKNGTGNLGAGFGFDLQSSDTTFEKAAEPEGTDLESMTVVELKALAKERGLSGYSGLSKEELIDLLLGCE